jgi:hypothetical protein
LAVDIKILRIASGSSAGLRSSRHEDFEAFAVVVREEQTGEREILFAGADDLVAQSAFDDLGFYI